MITKDSRIKIITGHFGSGKTEIAINLSLNEKEVYQKVAIADLDVVNPYFRSRDVFKILDEKGIELIAPKGQLATSDLPIVSGEIYRVIHNTNYRLIIDLGGDKDGATALGQYYNDIIKYDYQMYFVVNINRPYVSDVNGIITSIMQIELASRLKVTGIINNTHLGSVTELDNLQMGADLAKQVGEKLGIPFLYTTISYDFSEKTEGFSQSNNVLYIYRFTKLPWE
ncbi:MAG: hypothetical protein AB7V16_06725 [Vulcanibacillus sp.]